ncbi:MAG: hypothetical protein AB2798_06710 [Candidatus Thiodiazotropha endolucinida]
MLSVWDTTVSHDATMGAILAKGMSVTLVREWVRVRENDYIYH